jgi:cytochrome c oxidase assembly protein subunit 15
VVKQRFISITALSASFFALCVIGLGAFTRLIDAGLGCPDWPGCYGHLTAPLTDQETQGYPNSHFDMYKAWAEMIHRYFAGALSVLILMIIVMIIVNSVKTVKNNKFNFVLAISLLVVVIYQILLGQLTVTLKLLPIIVTQHLLGGYFILSLLWIAYLNNKTNHLSANQMPMSGLTKYFIFAIIAMLLLLFQIALGAWTSTNYASLSCPDFPFCVNADPFMTMQFKQAFTIFSPIGVNYDGGILPEAIRQTIQMSHRFGALMVTGYMLIFTAFAISKFKYSAYLMKSIYLIWGVLIIQLCIGMTNVIFKLPLVTAISHTLMAVLLLLAVLTLIYKLAIYPKKAF